MLRREVPTTGPTLVSREATTPRKPPGPALPTPSSLRPRNSSPHSVQHVQPRQPRRRRKASLSTCCSHAPEAHDAKQRPGASCHPEKESRNNVQGTSANARSAPRLLLVVWFSKRGFTGPSPRVAGTAPCTPGSSSDRRSVLSALKAASPRRRGQQAGVPWGVSHPPAGGHLLAGSTCGLSSECTTLGAFVCLNFLFLQGYPSYWWLVTLTTSFNLRSLRTGTPVSLQSHWRG